MEQLIVAVLVAGCSVYAMWKLMPSAARRGLAAALLRVPNLPQRLMLRLQRIALATPGCGCDGCDAGASAAKRPGGPAAVQPIVFRPRPPR